MADKPAEERPTRPARPAPTPWQSFTRFGLIFLGVMALYAMFDPSIGRALAGAAGTILFPLIGFGGKYPVITILLGGLLTTTISGVLRHYLTPWIKMARMNKINQTLSKENMDAMRKGNMAKVAKVKEKRMEVMKEFTDIQWVSIKQIGATMLLFIVFYTWLSLFMMETLVPAGNIMFSVPWSWNTNFFDAFVLPTWLLLYSLLAIPFGQVLQRVLKYFSFRHRLEEMGALSETTAPEDSP